MLLGVENASHARSSDVSGFSGRQSVMPTAEIAPVSLRCDGNDAAAPVTGLLLLSDCHLRQQLNNDDNAADDKMMKMMMTMTKMMMTITMTMIMTSR